MPEEIVGLKKKIRLTNQERAFTTTGYLEPFALNRSRNMESIHYYMSDKILIIAEKPSVAADLVKVLPDKFKKEKTHYEGNSYIVSYAIGHLVSICFPEERN